MEKVTPPPVEMTAVADNATLAVGGKRSADARAPTECVDNEMRILVLAPTSNDAHLTAGFLRKPGMEATICANVPTLCDEIERGCGAILLAEEALAEGSIRQLVARIEGQPSWSDLPVVIITGTGEAGVRRSSLAALEPVGNVSVIERPVRPGTLVSTFQSALRSRRRQYQVRALLEEREEMTARAQQQARVFDTTLSSIADFTYIFDRAGRFIYANKPLLDLLGISLADIAGRTFHELPYPTEMAGKLQRQIQQVFETGKVLRDETPYTNPRDETGYYEYIFSPVFGADGEVEVVAGSTRDTSERRWNEEKLREADRRKDEFLAMLAHELRNPLASVASAAALLRSPQDKGSHEWAAGVVERQTRQLARLIDDLLDVSRITTGKIRLRKQVMDAAEILDHACESARPLVVERGHDFVCNYDRSVLWVNADPTRLEQVLLNLLTNAVKYTPAGGRIELNARRLDGEILITVRDDGVGIAPHRLPEMFQLFAQGERSIARSEGGLGIGLTIVQRLVEMHDGRVEAHSDGPNSGSTFTIRIPAAEPPAAEKQKLPAPLDDPASKSLRVLVVDDNVDTAHALARLLTRRGHQITIAHDGRQAVDRARTSCPEVVVLDIGLPGMDGFEVIRHLRVEPCCAGALMIALTGYGQEEDRQRTLSAGFDHHLVKPVDFAELKKLLVRNASPQASEAVTARI